MLRDFFDLGNTADEVGENGRDFVDGRTIGAFYRVTFCNFAIIIAVCSLLVGNIVCGFVVGWHVIV